MRDAYRIRRIIYEGECFYSSLTGKKIEFPEYYIEHINTGCILSMEEYNEIRHAETEENFIRPEIIGINQIAKEGLEELFEEFDASLDCLGRKDMIGKDMTGGLRWKVVNGELVEVTDRD